VSPALLDGFRHRERDDAQPEDHDHQALSRAAIALGGRVLPRGGHPPMRPSAWTRGMRTRSTTPIARAGPRTMDRPRPHNGPAASGGAGGPWVRAIDGDHGRAPRCRIGLAMAWEQWLRRTLMVSRATAKQVPWSSSEVAERLPH
jgi:hypothetical protein